MSANPATAREPDRSAACPSCGAAVLTAVSWCTLCFASLVPAPVPTPTPAPEPQATRHPVASATASDVEAIADRLLAELAATRAPDTGWMARLPRSGGAKAGLIVGGAVIGSTLLVLLMALVGLFL